MSTTVVVVPLAQPAAPALRRRGPRLVHSLRTRSSTLLAVGILLIFIGCALFAPAIAPHPPRSGEVMDSKLPPAWLPGGDPRFLLGTDELGRDILSRVIFGAQISLAVGFTAVALAGAVGITLGLLAGYFRGPVDDVIMRLGDVQLALPQILMAIAILATLGPGPQNVVLTLAITGWVTYARVVRGEVLSLREKEFVQAARCIGVNHLSIMFRHILPNVTGSIIVIASFAVAATILAEAALSFLGLSVGPDVPTWGGMVASGRDQIITGQWWIYTFPGLAIMLTVLGINLIGDWLRDYLDPRLKV
ncbi:MAG: ABC transporter permease [Chloroflexi bacterium]|nr:ABC transporter permease [Chloroflexota bacterium]MBV9543746.1 ABC transporter permease [Chloroflexota bacterium]